MRHGLGKSPGYVRSRSSRIGCRAGCRPASLLAAYARLETAQKVNAALAFHGLSPVKDVGQVHVCAAPHEARRHHADHRADLVVEPEFTAQDPAVAAELPLPELVAEHHHGLGALLRVGLAGAAPDLWRHPHHIEGVHGAVIAAQPLGLTRARPGHVAPGGGDHPAEHRIALRDFEELVDLVVTAVSAALPLYRDAHQAVGILVGERIQDDGVDHGVHGGAAADTERQRADGDGRKRRCLAQAARAETEVPGELSDPRKSAHGYYDYGTDGGGAIRLAWGGPTVCAGFAVWGKTSDIGLSTCHLGGTRHW